MPSVLILTKTEWKEPPRIRHQITRLLKNRGYEIIFIERNSYKNLFVKRRVEEGITFYGHTELIHHQLRIFRILQGANNLVVKYYLKRILNEIRFDLVINFCYDYSFLAEIIPNKKIITFINDDFEAQAKIGSGKHIGNQMAATCKNSDVVLTVSYPLLEKLKKFNSNTQLFFPWSNSQYMAPRKSQERDTVLYFGFIGRLDWHSIELLLKKTSYKYRFIGPFDKSKDTQIMERLLDSYTNIEYQKSTPWADLETDDVFCSILPYDPNKESVQACTISNRAFNLLSRGLPLVYADLRYLLQAPRTVIRKNKSVSDYIESLGYFHANFYNVQKDIELFIEQHYEDSRWELLERIMESNN